MSQRVTNTGRPRSTKPNPFAGIRPLGEIPAFASRPVRPRSTKPNPFAGIRPLEEIPAFASRPVRPKSTKPNPFTGIRPLEEKAQSPVPEQKAPEQQIPVDVIPEQKELESEYKDHNYLDPSFDYVFCKWQRDHFATEMKRNYRKPGESLVEARRANRIAQTQFHFWEPLMFFKAVQSIIGNIVQVKQRTASLRALAKPTTAQAIKQLEILIQNAEEKLESLENQRDQMRGHLRTALAAKKKWDSEAAELKHRTEADQHQIPQQTPQEKRLGFDPSWFQDPEQLQWNTTAALLYFNRQKDIYTRSLQWQVEGFVPDEQIVFYVRFLLASTLLIRAALLTAQRASPRDLITIRALEDRMQSQTRLLKKWLPQMPADAKSKPVPDAEDLDTRWFSAADLTKSTEEIRTQTDQLKKQMDALHKSNQGQPSLHNDRQLHMQAIRHLMLFTLYCYRVVEIEQKAQAEGVMLQSLLKQFDNANQQLRAALTSQDVLGSSDIPDILLTSQKQTPEPTTDAMKRRRVELAESSVASEKHAQLRLIRHELSAARKRLAALEAASDANAGSTLDTIRLLIHQAHSLYNDLKSDKSVVAEFPEFEELEPDAKRSISIVQAKPIVVRKQWNPPEAAAADQFTDDEWKRSTDEDKKRITVCVCVLFVLTSVCVQLLTKKFNAHAEVRQDFEKEGQYNKWDKDHKELAAKINRLRRLVKHKDDRSKFRREQALLTESIDPDQPEPEQLTWTIEKLELEIAANAERISVAESSQANQLNSRDKAQDNIRQLYLRRQQMIHLLQIRTNSKNALFEKKKEKPQAGLQPVKGGFVASALAGQGVEQKGDGAVRKRIRKRKAAPEPQVQPEPVISESDIKAAEEDQEQEDKAPSEDTEKEDKTNLSEDQIDDVLKALALQMARRYVKENRENTPERFRVFNSARFTDIEHFQAWQNEDDEDIRSLMKELDDKGLGFAWDRDNNFGSLVRNGREIVPQEKLIQLFLAITISLSYHTQREKEEDAKGEKQAITYFKDGSFKDAQAYDAFMNLPWIRHIYAKLRDQYDIYLCEDADGITRCDEEEYEIYRASLEAMGASEDNPDNAGVEIKSDGKVQAIPDTQKKKDRDKRRKKLSQDRRDKALKSINTNYYPVSSAEIDPVWTLDFKLCEAALRFADSVVPDSVVKGSLSKRIEFDTRFAILSWSSGVFSATEVSKILANAKNNLSGVFDPPDTKLDAKVNTSVNKESGLGSLTNRIALKEGKTSGWRDAILAINIEFARAIRTDNLEVLQASVGKFISSKAVSADASPLERLRNLQMILQPRKLKLDEMGVQVALVLALVHPPFFEWAYHKETAQDWLFSTLSLLAPQVFWALMLACKNPTPGNGPLDLDKQPWILGAWIAMHHLSSAMTKHPEVFLESTKMMASFHQTYATLNPITEAIQAQVEARNKEAKKEAKEKSKTSTTGNPLTAFIVDRDQDDLVLLKQLLDVLLPNLLYTFTHRPTKNHQQSKQKALDGFDGAQQEELKRLRERINKKIAKKNKEKDWKHMHSLAPELCGQVLCMRPSRRQDEISADYSNSRWRAMRFRLAYHWFRIICSFAKAPPGITELRQTDEAKARRKPKEQKKPEEKTEQPKKPEPKPSPARSKPPEQPKPAYVRSDKARRLLMGIISDSEDEEEEESEEVTEVVPVPAETENTDPDRDLHRGQSPEPEDDVVNDDTAIENETEQIPETPPEERLLDQVRAEEKKAEQALQVLPITNEDLERFVADDNRLWTYGSGVDGAEVEWMIQLLRRMTSQNYNTVTTGAFISVKMNRDEPVAQGQLADHLQLLLDRFGTEDTVYDDLAAKNKPTGNPGEYRYKEADERFQAILTQYNVTPSTRRMWIDKVEYDQLPFLEKYLESVPTTGVVTSRQDWQHMNTDKVKLNLARVKVRLATEEAPRGGSKEL